MHDDVEKKRQAAQQIQEDLNNKRLSRRGLLQRLKFLGVGFGAAYILSAKEANAVGASNPDESGKATTLKSTNPALNDIIEEGRQDRTGEDDQSFKTAWYRRVYFRGYRRFYGRYGRGYARFYRRFG
jgi:hypothetical protein